jgi:hypothetical protein
VATIAVTVLLTRLARRELSRLRIENSAATK